MQRKNVLFCPSRQTAKIVFHNVGHHLIVLANSWFSNSIIFIQVPTYDDLTKCGNVMGTHSYVCKQFTNFEDWSDHMLVRWHVIAHSRVVFEKKWVWEDLEQTSSATFLWNEFQNHGNHKSIGSRGNWTVLPKFAICADKFNSDTGKYKKGDHDESLKWQNVVQNGIHFFFLVFC